MSQNDRSNASFAWNRELRPYYMCPSCDYPRWIRQPDPALDEVIVLGPGVPPGAEFLYYCRMCAYPFDNPYGLWRFEMPLPTGMSDRVGYSTSVPTSGLPFSRSDGQGPTCEWCHATQVFDEQSGEFNCWGCRQTVDQVFRLVRDEANPQGQDQGQEENPQEDLDNPCPVCNYPQDFLGVDIDSEKVPVPGWYCRICNAHAALSRNQSNWSSGMADPYGNQDGQSMVPNVLRWDDLRNFQVDEHLPPIPSFGVGIRNWQAPDSAVQDGNLDPSSPGARHAQQRMPNRPGIQERLLNPQAAPFVPNRQIDDSDQQHQFGSIQPPFFLPKIQVRPKAPMNPQGAAAPDSDPNQEEDFNFQIPGPLDPVWNKFR